MYMYICIYQLKHNNLLMTFYSESNCFMLLCNIYIYIYGYKQTNTQTDRQTDKPNLYIDKKI